MNIVLSPIEKIHIISGIKKKIVNKQNTYTPIVVSKKTSDKFKPGFKSMYRTFFQKVLYNKKNNQLINIKDLIKIYSICEVFEKEL